MKKYMLFMYSYYDAGGGFNDFIDSFDSIDDAERGIVKFDNTVDKYHIVDRDTGNIVKSGSGCYC